MLVHILERRPVYRIVFHTSIDVGVRKDLHARLVDQLLPEAGDELTAAFAAGGLLAALEAWATGERVDVTTYATATASMVRMLVPDPSGLTVPARDDAAQREWVEALPRSGRG